MNVTEMHIAVQQGVDKINSLQADSLLSQEIDIELNKSVFKFINTKYGKNNKYRTGFEESQKRIDDLRTLVREYENSVTFKEVLRPGKIWVDTFRVPNDYMYLVNQQSTVWINKCKPMSYTLVDTTPLSYFVLDLNDFVSNNMLGASTEFVDHINMVDDISSATPQAAVIWTPSAGLLGTGYTAASYPLNVDAVKQDILNNPGPGMDIYWEEFETLNFPGKFVVIVNTNIHPWFSWDGSLGAITQAVGYDGLNNALVYAPAEYAGTVYSEKRVPGNSSEQLTVGNRFSQQDDIFTLLTDPFNTTKYDAPLTTMRGNAIDVYTSGIFITDTVKITYIRKPREISLSLGIDCELPEHTHQELISLTVNSILEGITDPRYKTHLIEADKSE